MRVILYLLAVIGLLTVYEFARPYALQLVREPGWDFGNISYDGSTKRKRGRDWDNPEANDWGRERRR